jgi:hypothetical protein
MTHAIGARDVAKALAAFGLATVVGGCQSPELRAIDHAYVGADAAIYGRTPAGSAVANGIRALKNQPQARCAVVEYDVYGRPDCAAVVYID